MTKRKIPFRILRVDEARPPKNRSLGSVGGG
jgi:hypothetical protein